jgi:hypothetical protein
MPAESISGTEIRDPWLALLRDVDAAISQTIDLHCAGGFAFGVLADWPRPTGDIDVIGILPTAAEEELLRVAGRGAPLARKHKVHVQIVTVTAPPFEYRDRLIDATPARFRNLTIRLLEPHDLALTKLDRNSPKDREDVRFMAERGLIESAVLKERYAKELKPYALNQRRLSLNLELWLDDLFGD